jgi:hypothetical protein
LQIPKNFPNAFYYVLQLHLSWLLPAIYNNHTYYTNFNL